VHRLGEFLRDNALIIMMLMSLIEFIRRMTRDLWRLPGTGVELIVDESLEWLSRFLARYRPFLHKWASWWLLDQDRVKDVVQATCVRVLRQVGDPPLPKGPRLWLRCFVLLLNQIDDEMIQDHALALREGRALTLPLGPEAQAQPLNEALRCLPPKHRRRLVARQRYGAMSRILLLVLRMVLSARRP
jgi:DNA-directed RNA polymerase specialized sigma24 family protein